MPWIARSLMIFTAMFWSMSFIWGKAAMAWAEPLTLAALRYGLAGIVLLAVALPSGGVAKALTANWRAFILLGVVGIAGNQAFAFAALRHTSAVNGALIMALTPLFTTIGAALFLGETMTRRARLALMISLVGTALAVLGDGGTSPSAPAIDLGEPMMLLAALCLAFYNVGLRRFVPNSVPVLSATAICIAIGALVLIPLALLEPVPTTLPPIGIALAIVGMALGGTVFGFLSSMQATRVLGAMEPSVYFNLVPVITMVFAALHGTPPVPAQIIGALLVVSGVMLSMRPAKTESRKQLVLTDG